MAMLVSEQPSARRGPGRPPSYSPLPAEQAAALAARQSAIEDRLARRAELDEELRLLGYRDPAAAGPKPGQRCHVCGEVKPIVAAGLAVDLLARRATYRGEPIRLQPLPLDLLALLLRRPGRWIAAEALSQAVYGLPYAEMATQLGVAISTLRRQLRAAGVPVRIETRRGDQTAYRIAGGENDRE